MKKVKYILLLALIICMVSGCGQKDAQSQTQGQSHQGSAASEDEQGNTENQGEEPNQTEAETGTLVLSRETLGDYPVTDPSEFDFEETENGVAITACHSDAEVIVVPETLGDNNAKVTEIGERSFGNCTCKGIKLPDSVVSIGENAFTNCEFLEVIDFGNSLKNIGAKAFNNCPALHEVIFPESIISIGRVVFANCDSLQTVVIPENATEIGVKYVFNCPNAVVVTPSGSAAEAQAIEDGIPVRNP